MIYQVRFVKAKTYWWDEDKSCLYQFATMGDTAAIMFISIITERMNRAYARINEPRNISVDSLFCLSEEGWKIVKRRVDFPQPVVYSTTFFKIRSILEAFYPKNPDSGIRCSNFSFTEYKPSQNPRCHIND